MFSVIHRGCFWHNFFNFPFVPKFEKHTPQLFLCPISTLRKAKREIVVLKIDMSTHLRSSSSTVKSSLISLVYAKACLRTLHILSQSVSPVTQSCQTLCDPWTASCQASLSITNFQIYSNSCPLVSDAIQPSHPLSSPSPPTFSLSQH